MRSLLTGLPTLALGLATCLSATAQPAAQNPNQGQNQSSSNQNRQGERKAIQGVIAAVTVEGELLIDQRTNRAASAEMTFLTIVGSERPRDRQRDDAARNRDRDQNDRNDRDAAQNRDRDQNDRNAGDRQASSDRQRHNVYVVWLTPRTEIRRLDRDRDRDRDNQDANRNERDRGDRNTGANANASNRGVNASALTIDALEVGDRVEVQFVERGAADSNQNRNQVQNQNPNAASRKHGRHRTYYGEAVAINILSSPDQNDRDRDSGRDQNRDRNRDQNNQNNDRNDNPNQ